MEPGIIAGISVVMIVGARIDAKRCERNDSGSAQAENALIAAASRPNIAACGLTRHQEPSETETLMNLTWSPNGIATTRKWLFALIQ
jgi:hypothetical protein